MFDRGHYFYSDKQMARKKKDQYSHLKWNYDSNTNQYALSLQPLCVATAWEKKNKDGQFKWFARIITIDVFDIEDEFETFQDAKDYCHALIQSLILTVSENLFGKERAYDKNN